MAENNVAFLLGEAPEPVQPLPTLTPVDGIKPRVSRLLTAPGASPEYDDHRIPLGDRLSNYLQHKVNDRELPDAVDAALKDRFGITDENERKKRLAEYDRDLRTAEASKANAGQRRGLAENAIDATPFLGSAVGLDAAREYRQAKERIAAGKAIEAGGQRAPSFAEGLVANAIPFGGLIHRATGGGSAERRSDYDIVAQYEAKQQADAKRSLGGKIAGAVSVAPAFVAENALGMGVAGAATTGAKAVGASGRLMRAAETGVGQRALGGIATPSMYAKQAEEAAAADPSLNLAQAYVSKAAYSAVQNVILGQLSQKIPMSQGGAVGAAKFAGRVGVGMTEQAGLDVSASALEDAVKSATNYSLGIGTRYGSVGELARGIKSGNMKDAWDHLAVEAATFATFGLMHQGQGRLDLRRTPQPFGVIDPAMVNRPEMAMVRPAEAARPELQAEYIKSKIGAAIDAYKPKGMSGTAAANKVAEVVKSVNEQLSEGVPPADIKAPESADKTQKQLVEDLKQVIQPSVRAEEANTQPPTAPGPTVRSAQKAPWEYATPEELQADGKTEFFRTSQGSLYARNTVTGQTMRVKSDHTGVGHEPSDTGLKRPSDKTVYVDANKAGSLSSAGLQDGSGKPVESRLVFKGGKATLLTRNKDGRWGSAPSGTEVPVSDKPFPGSAPLEAWKKTEDIPGYEAYSNMHAGNAIDAKPVSAAEGHAAFKAAFEAKNPTVNNRTVDTAQPVAQPTVEQKPATAPDGGWMNSFTDAYFAQAKGLGIVESIEKMAADGLVGKQIERQLSQSLPGVDRNDLGAMVASVRNKLGIPSQMDFKEFSAWRDKYLASKPATAPETPPVEPEPNYVPIAEAARAMGVTEEALLQRAAAGEIVAVQQGTDIMVPRSLLPKAETTPVTTPESVYTTQSENKSVTGQQVTEPPVKPEVPNTPVSEVPVATEAQMPAPPAADYVAAVKAVAEKALAAPDSKLTPEQRDYFRKATAEAIDAIPEAVRPELARVKDVRYFPTRESLTRYAAENANNPQEAKRYAQMLADGVAIAGQWNRGTGRMLLDGDRPTSEGGIRTAKQIHAHEFTHVLEGENHKFSSTPEWKAIFASEFKGKQLTDYASTKASEAFAEFGRLVYADKVGEKALMEKFPKATEFWKKNGLLPEANKAAYEKPAEVFGPEPIDIGTTQIDPAKPEPVKASQPPRAKPATAESVEAARKEIDRLLGEQPEIYDRIRMREKEIEEVERRLGNEIQLRQMGRRTSLVGDFAKYKERAEKSIAGKRKIIDQIKAELADNEAKVKAAREAHRLEKEALAKPEPAKPDVNKGLKVAPEQRPEVGKKISKAQEIIARKRAEAEAEKSKAVIPEGEQVATIEGAERKPVIEEPKVEVPPEPEAVPAVTDFVDFAHKQGKITDADRYVVEQRAKGVSVRKIAQDPEYIRLKGKKVSYETVSNDEQRALAAIGAEKSLHAQKLLDEANALADRVLADAERMQSGDRIVVDGEEMGIRSEFNPSGSTGSAGGVARLGNQKSAKGAVEATDTQGKLEQASDAALDAGDLKAMEAISSVLEKFIRTGAMPPMSRADKTAIEKYTKQLKGQGYGQSAIERQIESSVRAGEEAADAVARTEAEAGRGNPAGEVQGRGTPDAAGASGEPAAADGVTEAMRMLADKQAANQAGFGGQSTGMVADFAKATGRSVRDVVATAYEAVNNEVRRLAGQIAPAVTRISPRAGESVARYAASGGYGRALAARLIDKVMGEDLMRDTPDGKKITVADRIRVGAVIVELRLRYMRDVFLGRRDAINADAARQKAVLDTMKPSAAKDKMERLYKKTVIAGKRAQKDAEGVKTIVGQVLPGEDAYGNPMIYRTEADFRSALTDPLIQAAIKRYQEHVVPVIEDNYRRSQGLDPSDTIGGQTQIPGLPINLKAFRPGDEARGGVVSFPGEGKGELRNPKLRKYKYAREAKGNAQGYYLDIADIITDTVVHGAKVASQADMYRTLVDTGIAKWAEPGQQVTFGEERGVVFRDVNPPARTQDASPTQKNLVVDPKAAGEIRQALDADNPTTMPILSAINGSLTKIALASTVEAVYHAKNLVTMLWKPGVNPLDVVRNAHRLIKGDGETKDRIIELARIGAFKESGFGSGMLVPERMKEAVIRGGYKMKYKHLDPTFYLGEFVHALDKTMRLTASDAFDNLERRGLAVGDQTNKRDFINQLGQYNKAVQSKAVKLLRDTGFGPFATAATNYYMQGLRAMTGNPGLKATSMSAAIQLRATYLARILATAGTAAVFNYLVNGRVDGDDDTPLGSIKIGEKDGKIRYFDLLNFTGLTRGMRETGLLALANGIRHGEGAAKVSDEAFHDAIHSALHPATGPAVAAAYMFGFGKNTLGNQVAETKSTAKTPAGIKKAEKMGKPGEDTPQWWLNLQATLWNVNPTTAMVSGRNRPPVHNEPGKPQKPVASTEEKLWSFLGPFGMKFRSKVDEKKPGQKK